MISIRFKRFALLFLVLFIVAGCSGGSDSTSETTNTDPAGSNAEGFTAELLDANPTLYFTESDASGTFQTRYAFTGSNGTYTFEVSDYQFDSQGNLTDSFQGQFPAVLQEDGTLSVTTPEEVAVLELLEVSPGQYLVVTGPGDAGPWEETWYYTKPVDWVEAGTPVDGFTIELLDPSPTLYFTESDASGTFQTSYAITGSNGTYILEVSDFEFDSLDNLIFSFNEQYPAELQPDGTLAVTLPDSSVDVLDLIEVNPNVSWVVTGPDDGGTWTETWYYSKPADWVEAGIPATGFTAELLDTNPTLYVSETVTEGIDQTIIKITGNNGEYILDVSEYEFYDQGNLTASWTGQYPAELQVDGTLLVTLPERLLDFELLEVMPNVYWKVTGENGAWTETWYYSKPADWIEAGFTAADFNNQTHYLLSDTGVEWDTFTLETFSDGTLLGATGLVNPLVTPDFTGTWEIDAEGRLYIVGEAYYTLSARNNGFLETCWGATPAEADACGSPEIWYTDFDAANTKASVYPPVQ